MNIISTSFIYLLSFSMMISLGFSSDCFLTRFNYNENKPKNYSQYCSKNCTLKYDSDIVYNAKEYPNLQKTINSRLEEIKVAYTRKQPDTYPNFMAVILCATGKNSEDKFKRVYTSLRVKKNATVYEFSRKKAANPVIFYSDNNNYDTSPASKYTFIKRADLSGQKEYDDINSHTEPLGLKTLITIKKSTFQDMIGSDYNLKYYEIHLVSHFDACVDCPKIIYNSIRNIKQYFNNDNLFMFYHSNIIYVKTPGNLLYPLWPYAVKHQQGTVSKYVKGYFSNYQYIHVEKLNDIPDKTNCQLINESNINISRHYFSICHGLEVEGISSTNHRRIMKHNKL